ncbi:molecular chaperone DnaJ [Actinobacteria bacterium YIM 96077]|uniref:Chaperone protein DnaJ n=1 Tax=Phytoactinopolyspora halophila TaxID=1981511 RepID=A0A329R0M9_9ACTN|nr:molecular chaperone DnaJ [Phytoactinopolyspora halophila]AYY15177.1 molecular chaperone DnaJ [Actinobacteria bacterium YIM 96077]RAW18151.1 molecular chaperone DnaJ [Phytoactinopolyspora halophila]
MSTKDWIEKDYYKILGVPKDADTAQVKKAYRTLARELHPDRNKDDASAEQRFKEVSEAYSVLSDPEKRKEYDEARSLFGSGMRVPGGGSTGRSETFTFDLGDLFSGTGGTSTGGGLGDVFGGLFGQRQRTRGAGARRGADVETEVSISFSEAVEGKTVPLRMTSAAACTSCAGTGARAGTVPRVCATCTGTGYTSTDSGGFGMAEPCRDCKGRGLVVDDPCPECHGSGRGTTSTVMQVRIPAGVVDGQRIRLRGKGAPGERGGRGGDLYVTVHVGKHPVFGRRGEHLTVTVPVTFPEVTLGAEIKVPTLDGTPVTLKIPPGTPNGRTFRVRGRGARRRDGTHGDLLVTVEVAVPENVSSSAKKALEEFQSATSGEDVRADLMRQAAKGG